MHHHDTWMIQRGKKIENLAALWATAGTTNVWARRLSSSSSDRTKNPKLSPSSPSAQGTGQEEPLLGNKTEKKSIPDSIMESSSTTVGSEGNSSSTNTNTASPSKTDKTKQVLFVTDELPKEPITKSEKFSLDNINNTSSNKNNRKFIMSQLQRWYQQMVDYWADAAGVNEIAMLKEQVNEAARVVDERNRKVQELRQQVQHDTKQAEQLSARHQKLLLLHRNGTDLLTDDDVQQFAQLTAAESKARVNATQSLQALASWESELQQAQVVYMDALRKRYQEEQVWQDKWRVLGTYWTWLLIGLNSVVFVAGQVLHWRREEARLQAIQSMIVKELLPDLLPQLQQHQPEQSSTTTRTTKPAQETNLMAPDQQADPEEDQTELRKEASYVEDQDTKVARNRESEAPIKQAFADASDRVENIAAEDKENEKQDLDDGRTNWKYQISSWWTQVTNAVGHSLPSWPLQSKARGQDGEEDEQINDNALPSNVTERALVWSKDSYSNATRVLRNTFQQARTLTDQLHWPSMAVGAVAALIASNLLFPRGGGGRS
ncbi:hypothetical protein ACA910_016181 [Epithemia clementina (nom. ined.)]